MNTGVILQGRYEIQEKIGEGGMGAVYKAIDNRLKKTVALKQTFLNEPELQKAFEREALLLANLHHPSLPRVIDHFKEAESQFLVMDYIDGQTLIEYLKQNRNYFDLNQIVIWTDTLFDVLEYLHSQTPAIIHRDIKPANININNKNQLFLLDFGLAKTSITSTFTVTTNRSVFGYSPYFASLEQIQGERTDARSDIYSLGATIYAVLTGKPPIDALKRAVAVFDDLPDPLIHVSSLNTQVSNSLAAVIYKSISLKPNLRYQTIKDFRKDFHVSFQQSTATPKTIGISQEGASAIPKHQEQVESLIQKQNFQNINKDNASFSQPNSNNSANRSSYSLLQSRPTVYLHSPEIRGFKLGMSFIELKQQFHIELPRHPDKFGCQNVVLRLLVGSLETPSPSIFTYDSAQVVTKSIELNQSVLKGYVGYKEITLMFLDEYMYEIIYDFDNSIKFNGTEALTIKLSEQLNLPPKWNLWAGSTKYISTRYFDVFANVLPQQQNRNYMARLRIQSKEEKLELVRREIQAKVTSEDIKAKNFKI